MLLDEEGYLAENCYPFEGVVVSRWMPRSSKPVAGRAERAAVGSTPIHSRQNILRPVLVCLPKPGLR